MAGDSRGDRSSMACRASSSSRISGGADRHGAGRHRRREMKGSRTSVMRHAQFVLLCTLLFVALGAGAAEGCGNAEDGAGDGLGRGANAERSQAASSQGALRPVNWGVGTRRGVSVQIGAFVPYCENIRPKPHIERIVRQHGIKGLIFTMLVRFPKRQARNCIGYDLAVTKWVKLGRAGEYKRVYDGRSHPPALRIRGR